MGRHERAHWRQLANTIEPSVSGGDAALCQITLTTYYYYYFILFIITPDGSHTHAKQ